MGSFSVRTANGRRLLIAYGADRLARHLLHLESVRKEQWLPKKSVERFDVEHPGLRISVEVKGSNNNNPIQWFVDQLEGQLKEVGFSTEPPPNGFQIGFPMDTGVVTVFNYRNRERTQRLKSGKLKKRKRLMKRNCKTLADQRRFLAENILTLYVVDIRLLNALRWHHGSKPYGWGSERRLIAVNRTHLRKTAQNTRSVLETIGLSDEISRWLPPRAGTIRSRTIETTIDGYQMKFELVPLLPIGLRKRFITQLNGNVKRVAS